MDEAANTAASNSGEKQKFFAGSVTFCGQRYTCQCRGSSSKSASAVGVDAGPIRNAPSSRTAVTGVGPYMTPANSCCPANFECKAFLPQSFKGNYYQIWCIVTGGAYLSAREVTWCVRNDYKNRFLPELYPQDAPNASQRPFSPPSFPARRKRWGRRRHWRSRAVMHGSLTNLSFAGKI